MYVATTEHLNYTWQESRSFWPTCDLETVKGIKYVEPKQGMIMQHLKDLTLTLSKKFKCLSNQ